LRVTLTGLCLEKDGRQLGVDSHSSLRRVDRFGLADKQSIVLALANGHCRIHKASCNLRLIAAVNVVFSKLKLSTMQCQLSFE